MRKGVKQINKLKMIEQYSNPFNKLNIVIYKKYLEENIST